MLNARTWHKLCLSGYLMFPALVAYWVFPDHPLIWLAYLALLWGGLVFVAGGIVCLLMTFGKMGLGCPICRAHSEVQGIHQSRITIQCPECGEMDLRIGQLSGLLSNEPKLEITDEDYLADDRPRYRSILHVPFCHPVAFGLLYFPVVGVVIAAAVIHQLSWFYLLIPGFFCYFLSGFMLESLFTGKMTDKGETITRAYSPFRFYSSLCSWLGVYLFALAFPVGYALQESKKEQTTQQEAETPEKNAALSLDEQYPLPHFARESLEKLQARVIFDGVLQPGESKRFENFGEVQSIGYYVDQTMSETPHKLSLTFSSTDGGWYRSLEGSQITPAEPPVKSSYTAHNDGPTPRRILVYTTPMEEPVKVSKLTSATLGYKDADQGNMAKISRLIHSYVADGATTVNLPSGKWQWHDLSQLDLPADAQKSLEIPLGNLQLEALEKQVRDWISTEQIKAVQISIDPQAPAKLFFSIEHVLSELKIPYALLDGTEHSQGKILLQQTDGKARVIAPDR